MIKPVGPNVLVRIVKKQSNITLLPGTQVDELNDLTITVEQIGTTCSLGVKPGQEIIIADKVSAVVIEQTEVYDLIIVPEVSIKAIKNYQE